MHLLEFLWDKAPSVQWVRCLTVVYCEGKWTFLRPPQSFSAVWNGLLAPIVFSYGLVITRFFIGLDLVERRFEYVGIRSPTLLAAVAFRGNRTRIAEWVCKLDQRFSGEICIVTWQGAVSTYLSMRAFSLGPSGVRHVSNLMGFNFHVAAQCRCSTSTSLWHCGMVLCMISEFLNLLWTACLRRIALAIWLASRISGDHWHLIGSKNALLTRG